MKTASIAYLSMERSKTRYGSSEINIKNPYNKGFFKCWRGLVDAFLNKDINFGFSLQHIQTAFLSMKIEPALVS